MAMIGEILVAAGHLDPEGLQEALDWQVLYGGRIGTNLLELKLTEEQHLARALGKQLGVEVAFGELECDPALADLIPKHIADRQEIVPWKMDKRRLKLLCSSISVEELDKLSYKIGRTCVPVVAPEYRIFQLLRAHYGATRQMRALDFGVVPTEGRAERKKQKAKEQGAVEAAPELIDEGAFNDIYSQMMEGRAKAEQEAKAGPSKPVARVLITPGSVAVLKAPANSWTPSIPLKSMPPVVAKAPAPPPPPAEEIEQLPDDAILGEADAPEVTGELAPVKPFAWEEPPPEAKPARDESPLEFSAAMKALSGVTDRDEIAHIVLRASRAKAARALLLQVQGGVAIGWDGLGEGMEAARKVALPLGAEGAFSLVVKTRSHYLGPLQKTQSNIRFLGTLGKKVPKSSLIFPILHRGRVSHMLYLDNGHKEQAPTDMGEMLILSQRISQSVEELVARKRKASQA
jgi:Type II secretion system (T2SS), protein E, N-terminal domain